MKIDHRFCFLGNPRRYEGPTKDSPLIPNQGTQDAAHVTVPIGNPSSANPIMDSFKSDEALSSKRWASKSYSFVKTSISSSDYDQALSDGYSIFDTGSDGIRVLRKRGVASASTKIDWFIGKNHSWGAIDSYPCGTLTQEGLRTS